MFATITINGEEYRLRYPGLSQIAIMKEAGKRFNINKQRPTLSDLGALAGNGDIEAQAYLLWQGIMGGMPEKRKMKFEEAVQLRDDFLLSAELDDGSRYRELLDIFGKAIDAAVGADQKKALQKSKTLQEEAQREQDEKKIQELKLIYKAQMLARQEIDAETEAKKENGTGIKLGESAVESSD
jgi:hypothetical protein